MYWSDENIYKITLIWNLQKKLKNVQKQEFEMVCRMFQNGK